jgi:pimeloyl-ACP methyl ester carboxylesterase
MITEMTLSNGELTFSVRCAGEGPVVLLLHGFPDTNRTFDAQLVALAAAGYRAVAPTMRGYHPESQPTDGDYHAIRMAEDVLAWLDQLGASKAHLVGHDWGANIAFAAVGLAPDRFASLSVIAVPHPVRFSEIYAQDADQQARSSYILDFLQPGFEDAIIADGGAWIRQRWQQWSPTWAEADAASAVARSALSQPGVARAALEYYRQAFDAISPAGAASAALFAAPVAVPTLGICGSDDGCIAPGGFNAAMQEADFPAALDVRTINGAGHFVHAESPDEVSGLLIDWFSRNPF